MINDVSCLNPTPISGLVTVRSEEDIRQALGAAREKGLQVSIAGARHSQGGHAFATRNVVLDMRSFNAMTLDPPARVLRVQSGATWHDIQERLHPRFAVKAMQSTDLFTVGGSISVNAHGMDHQEVGGVGLRRLVFNFSKFGGGVAMGARWWAEKHVEPWLAAWCRATIRCMTRCLI